MDSQLQSAIDLFAEFFDAIKQAVAIIDEQGNYVYYNEECARMDDTKVERVIGKPMLNVYPQMNESTSTLLQSLHHNTRYHHQYQIYFNTSGRAVHNLHTTLPLIDGNGRTLGAIEVGNNLAVISHLHEQVLDLQEKLAGGKAAPDSGIITVDPKMQKLLHEARRLAMADVQVLIYGETGTGKELFARLLHDQSARAAQPFIVLNCAALPEPLFESTLFGTVKGAFTGAQDRRGVLESASGGTLFLDELNSMPLSIQGKLLRVLQEKTYSRVGSNAVCKADVRILSASNEHPNQMIERGTMRPDLMYRLQVGYLEIPPLRERKADIPLLAESFIKKHTKVSNNRIQRINPAVMERLKRHHWPGNVRMLENILLRSLILCEAGEELDFVLLEDDERPAALRNSETAPAAAVREAVQSVHAQASEPPATALAQATADGIAIVGSDLPFDIRMAQFEKQLLLEYLSECDNLAEVARRCGLPRATLQYKIKRHGIRLKRSAVAQG
jgi:arginine utilization regulatory protein